MAELSPQTQQRVFIHVGAPKTGTTYLQRLLLEHKDQLADQHGFHYATESYDTHFFAALDLQDGKFHGRPRPESKGYWPKVAAKARSWPGTSLISHEVFAAASLEQAQRAVADLAPAEVHVIYTARDLARQLPSRWQEDVKHGLVDGFEEWWKAALRREPHPYAQWFWATDDPTDVFARWGKAVGAERFHVVTVPRTAASGELWSRFCRVVGLDHGAVDLETSVFSNPRLGIAEVELLRRVNIELAGRLPAAVYGRLVKAVLAHEVLAVRPGSRPLGLPPEHFDAVDRISRDWVAQLQAAGVDIVGDVEDLIPVRPATESDHPDSATEAELAAAAAWAIKEVLLRLKQERQTNAARIAALEDEIRELGGRSLLSPTGFPVRLRSAARRAGPLAARLTGGWAALRRTSRGR